MTLRNPHITFAIKAVTACSAFTLIVVGYSAHPLSGPTQNTVILSNQDSAEFVPSTPRILAQAGIAPVPTPPKQLKKQVTARSGDTFIKLMTRASVPRVDAHKAVTAIRKIFSPRDLRPGHSLTVFFTAPQTPGTSGRFMGLRITTSMDQSIRVLRTTTGKFKAIRIHKALDHRVVRMGGTIDLSLYTTAREAGLPSSVIIDIVRLFSWDIDFQRDIQRGDTFGIMVERSHLKSGGIARWGNILYAQMTVGGKTKQYYRFEAKLRNGRSRVGYFDERGHSARKPLLKTPVDGARLSSRYGKRRHPILGYTKMHRGIDFAAPRGTPIFAAGRGKIVRMGWNGAYGRYIRIRHNGRYSTAYGHIHRFARGMRRGKRVKQGQVIGYVGSTGRSTGPHLHYEILAKGRQVNPLRIRLPSGRKLRGKELASFQNVRTYLNGQLASIPRGAGVTQR